MHDELFICEPDPRGREVGEAANLLRGGAEATNAARVEVILDERKAIEKAVDAASEGDLLVMLVDDTEFAIQRVKGRSFRAAAPIATA
jgi:cyanophycin synthetase